MRTAKKWRVVAAAGAATVALGGFGIAGASDDADMTSDNEQVQIQQTTASADTSVSAQSVDTATTTATPESAPSQPSVASTEEVDDADEPTPNGNAYGFYGDVPQGNAYGHDAAAAEKASSPASAPSTEEDADQVTVEETDDVSPESAPAPSAPSPDDETD